MPDTLYLTNLEGFFPLALIYTRFPSLQGILQVIQIEPLVTMF